MKFQHEVYPPCRPECDAGLVEHPVSRQVFVVQDLEIRDRLAASQMNKFLYLYCSKEMPRKAHSSMVSGASWVRVPERCRVLSDGRTCRWGETTA